MEKRQETEMKKKWMVPLGILFLAVLLFFKADELAAGVAWVKQRTLTPLLAGLYAKRNDVDLTGYAPLEERDSWTKENRLVMHAGGGVDGQTYLNCMEGLEHCLENGCYAVELDFAWTDYGKIVISHRLNQVPYGDDLSRVQSDPAAYDEFYEGKVCFKYTPIRPEALLSYMKEHPELRIITDCKGNLEEILTGLLEMARAQDCEEVMGQFVIQIYEEADYDTAGSVYPFQDWIFTLYNYPYDRLSWSKITAFCLDHDIEVVTMSEDYAKEADLELLSEMGIKVYVHTINSLYETQKLFQKGVYGIYTDYLVRDDLRYIEGVGDTDAGRENS